MNVILPGILQPVPPDTVVDQAAEVKVAPMLPHRSDAWMVGTVAIPEGLKHLAFFGDLDDAADVDVRVHPLVRW